MTVRLPSLGAVIAAALATARRFPLVLIAGAASSVAAILLSDDIGPEALRERLLAAASLGLPLFTAAALFGERRGPAARGVAAVAAALALAGVYVAWPGWTEEIRALRYVQLSAAFHLAAAFAPFIGRDLPHAFWQYNRALLERGVIAAASSGTLFAGLAIALAAVDQLFGVDVPDQGYFRLWAVIAFTVTTWFFLGGVPADPEALEERRDYPTGLRIFAQFTLVPLVSVYLIILTVYLGKVVVTWDWPSGWIGWLVSGVAAAGILALLLVHPVAEREDQKWVRVFARNFWLAVLPAVVMLWLALWQRIAQYGVTEPRYFLVALSLWLFAVAVYYAVTRSDRIRVIPVSLCAVALASYAGPWSAYAVAERSQTGRLTALLERHGLLRDGRAARPAAPVSPADAREMAAVVRYLLETGRGGRLAPLVGDSLVPERARPREATVRRIVVALGAPWSGGSRSEGFAFQASEGALPLAGYDYLLGIRQPQDTLAATDDWWAAADSSRTSIRVARGRETLIVVALDSLLSQAARSGRFSRGRGGAALTREAANDRVRLLVRLDRVSGTRTGDTVEPRHLAGQVLVAAARRPPGSR